MLKFYIASGYENAANVSNLAEILTRCGFEHTLDWTKLPVDDFDPVNKARVSELELKGVREADVVVALMPGGFGTHCEIGAALALDKRVIIVDEYDNYNTSKVPFHYDENVGFIAAQGAVSVGKLIECLATIQSELEVSNAQKN